MVVTQAGGDVSVELTTDGTEGRVRIPTTQRSAIADSVETIEG